VTIDEPKQLEVATSILKQSPKINTIKEMENKKKMTKDELKEMVRQELQAVLAEKKKADEDKDKLDEATLEESPAAEILSILAGVAGLGLGSAAILKAQDMLKAKKPELYKKLQGISGAISAADPSKNI
jgi:predicted component of type VI protein secretion system